MKHLKTLTALAIVTVLSINPAMAQVDTTFVTQMQTDITTIVTAIGSALLIAGGIAVAFKWGKGALFG